MNAIQDLFTRFFEVSSHYELDLTKYKPIPEKEIPGFHFKIMEIGDLEKLKELYHARGPAYLGLLSQKLADPGHKTGFAFVETATGRIAYNRWFYHGLRLHSDIFNEEFNLAQNEGFTLDSYTHPDFRYKGLHKEMNARMLNYLQQNTGIKKIIAVYRWFNPHIKKIIRSLGYRPLRSKIYYKKGSLTHNLSLVKRKLFR